MGRTGGVGMCKWPTWAVRLRRRAGRWARIAVEDCLAPLRDRTAFLQLLALPIFLYLVFLARGPKAVTDEVFSVAAATQALVYALPFFVLWNLIAAVFKVRGEERKEGQWFDTSFVFNESKLVFVARVTDADNDHIRPFKIKDAEPNGYVYLNVEFDGFERRRLKAQVLGKNLITGQITGPIPWGMSHAGETNCAIYVGRDKTLYLATHCETQNWTIVKVYMTAFSIS